jgi:hypothetical protein
MAARTLPGMVSNGDLFAQQLQTYADNHDSALAYLFRAHSAKRDRVFEAIRSGLRGEELSDKVLDIYRHMGDAAADVIEGMYRIDGLGMV